jgi:hypothetical protein
MQTITVWNDKCQWRDVTFEVVGYSYPATFEHEAEYPEIVVYNVELCDEDGNPAELPAEEWKTLVALVWEAINE